FVPFGTSFNEFIKPFIRDIQLLEKGIPMKINNIEYLIIGDLGAVTIKKLRRQYNLLKSVQEKKDFVTRHRISIQLSPFSYLKFNPFQQIPQDTYHAVSGKITCLMEITIDLLSE
ncbi:8048_t:CDS:2, partial [Diversispora eburnea]